MLLMNVTYIMLLDNVYKCNVACLLLINVAYVVASCLYNYNVACCLKNDSNMSWDSGVPGVPLYISIAVHKSSTFLSL